MLDYTLILVVTLFIIMFLALIWLLSTKASIPAKPIGGCGGTRWGCCPGTSIAKTDPYGFNCPGPTPQPKPQPQPIGGCSGTRWGCCPNGTTPRNNAQGTNCS